MIIIIGRICVSVIRTPAERFVTTARVGTFITFDVITFFPRTIHEPRNAITPGHSVGNFKSCFASMKPFFVTTLVFRTLGRRRNCPLLTDTIRSRINFEQAVDSGRGNNKRRPVDVFLFPSLFLLLFFSQIVSFRQTELRYDICRFLCTTTTTR